MLKQKQNNMWFHKFVQNYLAGGRYWKTKIFGKSVYVNQPNVAIWFFVGFILAGLFQEGSLKDVPALFYTGLVIIAIAIFGFFYYDIFPNQRKSNPDNGENTPKPM